jgi:tRNA-2-methylthio-N6-dimethylallyladenosine synthase
VVRQSAEEKALGRLTSLRPLKDRKPELVINLMGCMVGVRGAERLRQRLPFVDVFSPPSDPGPLVSYLSQGAMQAIETDETTRRFAVMDGDLILPQHEQGRLVSAHVPVVYGCSHACTFCIIPFRRGIERSRPVGEIVAEIRSLAAQGVKEVTLLGQIVDRYGKDVPDGPDLAGLLRLVHEVEGIERIRFLTSHPNYFSTDLMQAVAELPKLMPHIEVPIQAGDDDVLEDMKRGYTQREYRELVEKIRSIIPDCSIATDIIVGFPGETHEQFMQTYEVLRDLRLDVAHLARYSSREGTVATRRMEDNVSDEEKMERFRRLEELQEGIVAEINSRHLGDTVEVLFEEKVRGRWKGRTPTNKLVFLESEDDLRGRVLPVQITWTGPWSMQGRRAGMQTPGLELESLGKQQIPAAGGR